MPNRNCLRHFEVEWEIRLLPLFSLAFAGTGSKFVPQYSSIVQFGTDPVSSKISLSIEANAFLTLLCRVKMAMLAHVDLVASR